MLATCGGISVLGVDSAIGSGTFVDPPAIGVSGTMDIEIDPEVVGVGKGADSVFCWDGTDEPVGSSVFCGVGIGVLAGNAVFCGGTGVSVGNAADVSVGPIVGCKSNCGVGVA